MTHAVVDAGVFAVHRPHRADAARNFDALLVAARTAFAAHGSRASLEDIARGAGVGIGTLYRNFPSRQHLFSAVYLGEVEQLCAVVDEVAELPAWDALVTWLRRFIGYQVTKRTMWEGLDRNLEMFYAGRDALLAAAEPLLARAQAEGEVRPDTDLGDVLRLIVGTTLGQCVDEVQFERVFTLALDGIRAAGRR
ncbi:MAG TPA: helix-turn-helix domain-containing protein [Pseudonocardia sp.]|jgi:AcrR family transcriptional regulator|nr:helix-turn-helix domain-containing protein [Pseudonocardia sp.]